MYIIEVWINSNYSSIIIMRMIKLVRTWIEILVGELEYWQNIIINWNHNSKIIELCREIYKILSYNYKWILNITNILIVWRARSPILMSIPIIIPNSILELILGISFILAPPILHLRLMHPCKSSCSHKPRSIVKPFCKVLWNGFILWGFFIQIPQNPTNCSDSLYKAIP